MTTVETPDGSTTTPASVEGPYDPEMKAAGQLTSPTWELELFLSGAFVFAMLQLPGLIERFFAAIEPHTVETTRTVLFVGTLYAKSGAFTLVVMFVVHLIARAYWVALLGLQSVFPKGIRWNEMRAGPIARKLYQGQVPDIAQSIAKLDNFCSIVFSVGLMIVFVFVYSMVLAAVVGSISYGLALVFTHGENMRYYFFTFLVLFVGIPVAAAAIDRRKGETIVEGSRGARVLHGLLRVAGAINIVRVTGPMTWTLMTNLGRGRSVIFLNVAVIGLVLVSTVDRLWQSDRLSINSYDFYGASRTRAVTYRFYENQREPGKAYPRTPSIQADIIRDPYVKLFVPYSPRYDNVAIARTCPTLKPIADRGLQLGADPALPDSITAPVLSCIARLHAITLDSVPRPDVEFSFYEHPSSGIKGVIAYIAVDSLPRGRHVIGVMPTPPVELPKDSVAREAWMKPTLIPFWR